jgi:hypothetical protein
MRFWFIPSLVFLLAACYEPKEGCLDIEATNYDVSADDQCPKCCTYPKLSVQVLHYIVSPKKPDSLFAMRYATKYQGLLDSNEFFFLDRGRFFISNLKLVRQSGEEVGVRDSVLLPRTVGDSIRVENNFSKHDRDILQAASLGTVRTEGLFVGVKFTIGIPQLLLDEVAIDSINSGALFVRNDTLSHDSLTGVIPVRFMLRPDTLDNTPKLDFQFKEPYEISLPFAQPVAIERGYNIKVVLGLNYSVLLENVDFKNDNEATIRAKIDSQLTNAFSIVSIKVE